MNTINEGEIYLETQVCAHTFLKGVALYKFCNVSNMLQHFYMFTKQNYNITRLFYSTDCVMKCWGEFHFGLYQATNAYYK